MTLHTNQGRHFFNHPKQTTFFISRSDYSFHQFEQTIPYTNQNTQLLHKLELTIPLTSACNASHQPKDKQLPTLKQLVLRLTVLRMMEKSVARVDSGKRKVIFRPCELHCQMNTGHFIHPAQHENVDVSFTAAGVADILFMWHGSSVFLCLIINTRHKYVTIYSKLKS